MICDGDNGAMLENVRARLLRNVDLRPAKTRRGFRNIVEQSAMGAPQNRAAEGLPAPLRTSSLNEAGRMRTRLINSHRRQAGGAVERSRAMKEARPILSPSFPECGNCDDETRLSGRLSGPCRYRCDPQFGALDGHGVWDRRNASISASLSKRGIGTQPLGPFW